MRIFSNFLVSALCLSLFLANCSSDDAIGTYSNTQQLSVDSTNDRLFVLQYDREMFALRASTLENLGEQPVVDEETNESIHDLLPTVPTQIDTYSSETTSRLFIGGAYANDDGDLVLNRIRVLDFDGENFSETDFSPIILSDGDDATDESGNSFSDILVDQDNGYVFVMDTAAGNLYVLNADDGSTVQAPLAIAGVPQGLDLDDGRLYICNTSETDAEQVVTVVNVADFTSTAIDLDVPCHGLAADSTTDATALLIRRSDTQEVLIREVDTNTYADSTAVASATSGYADGILSSGAGISSGINDIAISHDSSGVFHAYLSQQDGNIEYVTLTSDLASYSSQTLPSSALNIAEADVLEDTDGTGLFSYFVAESGYLISIEVGTDEVDLNN